jgi:hypothetical protein
MKILRSYTVNTRSMLEAIQTVGEGSLAGYTVKVHGIKGASNDIFAAKVGRDAENLENAAKAGDFDYIGRHHPAFLETAWAFVERVEAALREIDAENPKPVKDKPDGEVLAKLLAACKRYDMDEADAAMEEIEKNRYESDGGLAEWLRENMDRMDFSKIAEKLFEYLK